MFDYKSTCFPRFLNRHTYSQRHTQILINDFYCSQVFQLPERKCLSEILTADGNFILFILQSIFLQKKNLCHHFLCRLHVIFSTVTEKKIWSQNICSKFCWMLTADSDAFRFWPCEMLFLAYATPCISNIQTAAKALAVCIWICPGKQMLFRSVTSMQSFFLVFHGMRLHEIFDCILMASWEVTQWFVSRECLLVYNGKENSIKLSNQLFPKDLWIMECISLLLWAHHNSLYVCTPVCVSVYACLQIWLCFCEWIHTFLSVCCCATLCELKIECHKILFVCIILRKKGFYVFLLFDFYVILNHEKCRILKDRVNI